MSSRIELSRRTRYELRVLTLTERERQAMIKIIQLSKEKLDLPEWITDVLGGLLHKLL